MSELGDSIARKIQYTPLTTETAEAIAQHLVKLGQPINTRLKYLNAGGYAIAYWMADKKWVFKITTDSSDAVSMMYLKMKHKRGFVKVKDVFQIKQQRTTFYGIIAEHLQELSPKDKDRWYNFAILTLPEFSLDGTEIPYDDPTQTSFEDYLEEVGVSGKWVKKFDAALKNSPALRERLKSRGIESCMKSMRIWAKGLDALGIKWFDLHDDNIMQHGREEVLMDLGLSNVGGRLQLPEIAVD